MADITQQIAQGADITTPLLRGLQFSRQREQDALVQQQQQVVNQQNEATLQRQQVQQQFNNDFKMLGAANSAGLTGVRNKLLGKLLDEDPARLDALDDARQKKINDTINAASKIFHDTKVGEEETNNQVVQLGTLLKEELADPAGGVSTSPEVTGLAEQIRADAPQEQAQAPVQQQVQPQSQITPQDEITQLRQGVASMKSLLGTPGITPEQKANIEANVGLAEGRIKDLSKTGASSSRIKDEMDIARDVVASEKGISPEQVDPRDAFEKVKELRRALPGEAGEKESAVQNARRISTLKKEFPKQKSRLRRQNREWDRLDSVIDRAIAKIDTNTAGVGSILSFIRGSEARDLQNLLTTIKANRGFSNLSQMKQDSSTGGALGQVSELENILLQSVDGSLEPEQSAEQLKENLGILKDIMNDQRAETRDAFDLTYGEVNPTSSSREIRVREKSSGRTGKIPISEFNENEHERL